MKLLWGSWRAGLGVIMDTFHKFAFKLTCVYLSITSIQARNRDMIQARSYRGMQTRNPLTANYTTSFQLITSHSIGNSADNMVSMYKTYPNIT